MSAPPVQLLSASPDDTDTMGSSPIAIAAASSAGGAQAPSDGADNFTLSLSPEDDDDDAGGQGNSLFADAPDTPLGRPKPLPLRRRPAPPSAQFSKPTRNDTLSTLDSSSHSSHASFDSSRSIGTAPSSTPSRAGTMLSSGTGADHDGAPGMTASPSSTLSYPLSRSPSQLSNQLASPSPSQNLHSHPPTHSRTLSTSSIASSLGVAPVPSPAHDRKGHDAYARSQQRAQHSRHLSASSSAGTMAMGGVSASSSSAAFSGAYTGAGLSASPVPSNAAFSFGYRETLNARAENLADGSRTINQYRLTRQIGRGAYGTVYRAELLSDPGLTFAVKEVGKQRLRKTYRAANMRKMAMMRGRGRGRGGPIGASAGPNRAESALAKQEAVAAAPMPIPVRPVPIRIPAGEPGPDMTASPVESTPRPPACVSTASPTQANAPDVVASPVDAPSPPPQFSSSPSETDAAPGSRGSSGVDALVRGVKALQVGSPTSVSPGPSRAGFSVEPRDAAKIAAAGRANSPASIASTPSRGSSLETDPLFLIRQEIAILKKLNHPNVVKLYEVLDDPSQDGLYMVFENCPDGPVIDVHMHEQAQPLDEDVAREYFAQILLGIEYLHSNEIIHRDIKPDNILLTSDRQICKIVDFGVSEIFLKPDEDKLAKGAGTPAFMSPELCTAGSGDLHAMADDIWALGVTLYCMVVGRLPFEKSQIYELYESIKHDEPEYPAHLSPGLLDLLQGLLRKDHTTRYGISEARVHPWVTYDGTYPLVSVEENLETVVQEITEEELERAICKITSVFTIARAVQRFKRAGSTGKARTLSAGGGSGSGSNPGSTQGSFSLASGDLGAGAPSAAAAAAMGEVTTPPAAAAAPASGTAGPGVSLAQLVTRGLEEAASASAVSGIGGGLPGKASVLAPTVLSPTMETALEDSEAV
ncbi:hypothetical protein OC842_002634 [Tilletia horrida]|uniref:Protein kinase domain-containing protein n=1 Tax=Tilletia horrida TaxID=155126 RepID=A0AAN6GDA5_9BASI|nr:hypothetical protein OC842_002634 [Tilletia horrida]